MNLSSAYLLVFHGSRDPRTQIAVSELARLLAQTLENKPIVTQRKYLEQHLSDSTSKGMKILERSTIPIVNTAALELSSLPLYQSIIQFALQARKNGDRVVEIVPLFLSAGVHVREDIPSEIALAKKAIESKISIKLSPHIGKYSGMRGLLANKFARLPGDGRILLAHGSRLSGANDRCETLATELNAIAAYWIATPDSFSLDRQISDLVGKGKKRIAILPYFLFPGKITKAIANRVVELQAIYPQVELILDRPLSTTSDLAELIGREIQA